MFSNFVFTDRNTQIFVLIVYLPKLLNSLIVKILDKKKKREGCRILREEKKAN